MPARYETQFHVLFLWWSEITFHFLTFINARTHDLITPTTYIFWNLFFEKSDVFFIVCVCVYLHFSLAMQELCTIYPYYSEKLPIYFVKMNDRIKCKLRKKIENKLCLFQAWNSNIVRKCYVSINVFVVILSRICFKCKSIWILRSCQVNYKYKPNSCWVTITELLRQ